MKRKRKNKSVTQSNQFKIITLNLLYIFLPYILIIELKFMVTICTSLGRENWMCLFLVFSTGANVTDMILTFEMEENDTIKVRNIAE